MLVFDHFAVTAVLDDGSPSARALAATIVSAGYPAVLAELTVRSGHLSWYGKLRSWPGSHERGVLFLDPSVGLRGQLWSRHDHVVEHLESRDWEAAYLGHSECLGSPGWRQERSGLQLCDSVPDGLCALALRGQMLHGVMDAMPPKAVTGTFAPTDWMTIAAWMGRDLFRRPCTWLAWPAMACASSAAGDFIETLDLERRATGAAHV